MRPNTLLEHEVARRLPTVRPAAYAEIAEIADLVTASLEPFRGIVRGEILDRYIAISRDVEGRWDHADVLVIESNRRIVGTVTFIDHARRAVHELPSGWATFRTLAVHPQARGQGIGRHLVNHCVETARTNGASVIGLHTAAFMIHARRIYRSAGFLRCPEHDYLASAALGFDPADGDILVTGYRLRL